MTEILLYTSLGGPTPGDVVVPPHVRTVVLVHGEGEGTRHVWECGDRIPNYLIDVPTHSHLGVLHCMRPDTHNGCDGLLCALEEDPGGECYDITLVVTEDLTREGASNRPDLPYGAPIAHDVPVLSPEELVRQATATNPPEALDRFNGVFFVVGHGNHPTEYGTTFVPTGTTVHYHALEGSSLSQVAGYSDIQNASLSAYDVREAGASTPNYRLSTPTPTELRLIESSRNSWNSATRVFVMGVDTDEEYLLLCDNPGACRPESGSHRCGGLLGRLSGQLHVVACRVVDGVAVQGRTDRPAHDADGKAGDPTLEDELDTIAGSLWAEWIKGAYSPRDMVATLEAVYTAPTRALLLSTPLGRRLSLVLDGHLALERGRLDEYLAHYAGLTEKERGALDHDPKLGRINKQRRLHPKVELAPCPHRSLAGWENSHDFAGVPCAACGVEIGEGEEARVFDHMGKVKGGCVCHEQCPTADEADDGAGPGSLDELSFDVAGIDLSKFT